jgi:uncharacterized membrane protein YhhN
VTSTFCLPFIFLSAALTIYGELARRRGVVYVFKPLTTALIIAWAALLPADPHSAYRTAILVGLLFSLAGDVFLMLPSDRFIAGVVAFLAAHLAYLAAFTRFVPFAAVPWAFAVVALGVAAILFGLWSSLPAKMRPALVLYAAVLGSMTAQAISQAVLLRAAAASAAATGGLLFFLSDSLLVTNRFARPFRLAPLAVLGTYYAAQVLIAASVTVTLP